jgi:hypothetical protein
MGLFDAKIGNFTGLCIGALDLVAVGAEAAIGLALGGSGDLGTDIGDFIGTTTGGLCLIGLAIGAIVGAALGGFGELVADMGDGVKIVLLSTILKDIAVDVPREPDAPSNRKGVTKMV